jgi:hypothetical protein
MLRKAIYYSVLMGIEDTQVDGKVSRRSGSFKNKDSVGH